MNTNRSFFLWLAGVIVGVLLLLLAVLPFSSPTIVVDGSQRRQLVHGIGCYFTNQSLSPAVQRAIVDDLRLRTFRYPMFLQWEQAGGEFAVRDNDDPGQFDWQHYQRLFAKDREISTFIKRERASGQALLDLYPLLREKLCFTPQPAV